ncbi:MAG: signal transduction histidine kinase [Pirellulaceae bacterium]|jgi:signal transduction histidine kinase
MATVNANYREPTAPLSSDVDLEVVLDAWRTATERLQQTHEVLHEEVRRLSDELQIKNRELARKNRLADLGQMASHIAHEVRNSLMPVTLYLSLLKRRMADDQRGLEIMNKIEAGFTALETTVSDLLSFTAEREPNLRPFNVRKLLSDVCDSLEPQFQAQRISVEIDATENVFFTADTDMLRRALLNLVLNSIDVMPDGGELLVTAVIGARGLEIEVADSGPGIEQTSQLKIFDPFYTTKSNGTGLGLSIVQRVAEVHAGFVTATNCPQGGTAVTIFIPHRSMEAAA